jgi:RNA polymerase sigma-70 factor (ECF subfamily)
MDMSRQDGHIGSTSAPAEDVDLGLLVFTQAYLDCRCQGLAPGTELSEAWQQFYDICEPCLKRFAVGCNVPAADVEDCVQQVWAELLKKLPNFPYDPKRGRFCSWLFALVHSRAIDLLRRRRTAGLSSTQQADLCSQEETPAATAEKQGERATVQRVLAMLRARVSETNFRVFEMRWINEWTVQEVAARLGLAPACVRLRAHRTKRIFERLFRLCSRTPMT